MSIRGPEIAFFERWIRTPKRLVGLPPALIAVAAATLTFQASIRVLDRFIPEMLGRLGGSAIVLGVLAAVLLATEAAAPYWNPWSRRGSVILTGSLSVLGVVLWVLAPQFAYTFVLPAWLLVVIGAAATRLWSLHGPASLFAVSRERGRGEPRTGRIIRQTGVLLLLIPITVLLAFTAHFVAALQLVTALVAGVGAVAVVCLVVLPDCLQCPERTEGAIPVVEVRRTLDALPARAWNALAGIAGTRFVEGSLMVFLVVVVVDFHGVTYSLAGVDVSATTLFAFLLIAEAGTSLASLLVGPQLTVHAGPARTIGVGAAVLATFPLALVLAPSHALALMFVFAGYGFRFVGSPARQALFADTVAAAAERDAHADPDVAPRVAESVASASAIPGALAAGVLFAVSPVLAFAAVSAIGVVAAYMFQRFLSAEDTMTGTGPGGGTLRG